MKYGVPDLLLKQERLTVHYFVNIAGRLTALGNNEAVCISTPHAQQ